MIHQPGLQRVMSASRFQQRSGFDEFGRTIIELNLVATRKPGTDSSRRCGIWTVGAKAARPKGRVRNRLPVFGGWMKLTCLPGPIAQRLEQATHNRLVTGSNPVGPTNFFLPGFIGGFAFPNSGHRLTGGNRTCAKTMGRFFAQRERKITQNFSRPAHNRFR